MALIFFSEYLKYVTLLSSDIKHSCQKSDNNQIVFLLWGTWAFWLSAQNVTFKYFSICYSASFFQAYGLLLICDFRFFCYCSLRLIFKPFSCKYCTFALAYFVYKFIKQYNKYNINKTNVIRCCCFSYPLTLSLSFKSSLSFLIYFEF